MPFWRVALHVMLLGFAAQRAVSAFVLHQAGTDVVVFASLVLQSIAALLASLAMLTGRMMVLGVGAFAGTILIGAVAGVIVTNGASLPLALGELLLALASTAAFAFVMRQESRA